MPTPFVWPKEVTSVREPLPGGGMAYHLTHSAIGRLGRLVLSPLPTGGCMLDCDVLGNGTPAEIEARRKILAPLGDEALARLSRKPN